MSWDIAGVPKENPATGERPGLSFGWFRRTLISARAVRGVKGLTVDESACTRRAESRRACVVRRPPLEPWVTFCILEKTACADRARGRMPKLAAE